AGRAGRGGAGRTGGAGNGPETKATSESPSPQHPLNDDAVATIRALPDVKDVAPSIVVPVQIAYGETSSFTTARGVPLSAKEDAIFRTPKYGAFLPNDTDRTCLLGLQLADTLAGDAKNLVGKDVVISYASDVPPAGALGVPMGMPVQQVKLTY